MPRQLRILPVVHARAADPLHEFRFAPGDIILLGRESAGAPAYVHAACQHRVRLPLAPGQRSLNVAQAAGIFAYEACRQLDWFTDLGDRDRD